MEDEVTNKTSKKGENQIKQMADEACFYWD